MGVAISVSQDFIDHVRQILKLCLNDVKSGRGVRQGINGFSSHALPAYICAVAAVEAFLNESLLSRLPRMVMKDSALWSLPIDWLRRIEIREKLILVPQLLFGTTFSRGTQPYQDMALLVRVRNDLIHYKMSDRIPRYLRALEEQGIALRDEGKAKERGASYAWLHKLSCTEGVRWAHNTACHTVAAVVDLATEDYKPNIKPMLYNFAPIPEAEIVKWYEDQGIDPHTSDPPIT